MAGFIRKKTKIEIELNHDKKDNEALKCRLQEIGNNLTVGELEKLSEAIKKPEIKQIALSYLSDM